MIGLYVINITIAIYRGDDLSDITQGATLFYNPELMNGKIPEWNFDILEEVYIDGIDSDTFRSFRYKDDCLE